MNTPLYMLHQLDDIPNNSLPNSYRFRLFRQKNDSETWAKIVTATGEFPDENKAIERFNNEFKPHPNEVPKRIIFLETSDGHAAGTATAWFGGNGIKKRLGVYIGLKSHQSFKVKNSGDR
ncbi:hypothetical protein GCM10011409_21490 [Lentibacillus populi]|uniref:Uncharacterized protein n=1 Tax=Lentibacillus populi TaxID=1827502 RepID=A0A9W5TXK4_9BACI|nr:MULTISPECIES: hypothetical protein [Bacillaceae]MBT2216337.1 hypothetical protein [Virgibacillus dakarensis]GGB43622.1 hypothetical protein GCM10011409_21490 [Lentibacillus populi]